MTRFFAFFSTVLAVPAGAFALGPQDLAELAAVPEIDALAGVAAIAVVGASVALIQARRS